MRRYVIVLLSSISFFLLNGCASSFKTIDPRGAYYTNKQTSDSVEFSYQYDILRYKGNKKYAKKEDKKGIKVVAVKITNNTGNELVLGENFSIYSGEREIFLLDPSIVHKQLKQGVAIYLLYLPLTFTTFNTYTSTGNGRVTVNSTPIGYAIGPGITLLNMIKAGSANTNLKNELAIYRLTNRKISSGETVYGLISFQDYTFNPLSLKLK